MQWSRGEKQTSLEGENSLNSLFLPWEEPSGSPGKARPGFSHMPPGWSRAEPRVHCGRAVGLEGFRPRGLEGGFCSWHLGEPSRSMAGLLRDQDSLVSASGAVAGLAPLTATQELSGLFGSLHVSCLTTL